MAILDVLTVYQSWQGLQLFDEVKVQMHRYNRINNRISPPNFTIHASKVPFHANFMLSNDLQNKRQFPTKFLNMG